MRKIIIIIVCILLAGSTCHAGGDDILGVWNNQEKDAKIEIFKCGTKYCGKIISLREPNYPDGSSEGTSGTPRHDNNNPVAAKRSMPIMGLQIMTGFTFAGDAVWMDGTVYDPKSGNTYRGKMTLVSPDTLALRGFIGIPLFGKSTTWKRENIEVK
jgi:uncharacterized protein (DUF2147 family)